MSTYLQTVFHSILQAHGRRRTFRPHKMLHSDSTELRATVPQRPHFLLWARLVCGSTECTSMVGVTVTVTTVLVFGNETLTWDFFKDFQVLDQEIKYFIRSFLTQKNSIGRAVLLINVAVMPMLRVCTIITSTRPAIMVIVTLQQQLLIPRLLATCSILTQSMVHSVTRAQTAHLQA